jgi:hypothetical protein
MCSTARLGRRCRVCRGGLARLLGERRRLGASLIHGGLVAGAERGV